MHKTTWGASPRPEQTGCLLANHSDPPCKHVDLVGSAGELSLSLCSPFPPTGLPVPADATLTEGGDWGPQEKLLGS